MADSVGGADLQTAEVKEAKVKTTSIEDDNQGSVVVGTTGVTFHPGGFAQFDGAVNFLAADLTDSIGTAFGVSFWFRINDLEGQPVGGGLLASTKDPSYNKGLWEVEINQGMVRFDGKSQENRLIKLRLIEKPDAEAWYLLTLQFDESGKSGFWINDGQFTPFTNFDPASDPSSDSSSDPSIAFAPPPMLHTGTERTGSVGFTGDIDSVRLFNDTDWDDAKQAAAYAAGPEAPAQ